MSKLVNSQNPSSQDQRISRDRFGPVARASGFTLIEVLVAMFVFSFGLLAIAGLQLQSMRFTQGSGFRSIAAAQAATLFDQILANKDALIAGNYSGPSGSVVVACLNATGCTPAEMAQTSYALWNETNKDLLPGGEGIICKDSSPFDGTGVATALCDNAATSPYVIKVWWYDDRNATKSQFVTTFDLQ